MILIFSNFTKTGANQFKASTRFEVPSHHKRTITEANRSGLVHAHSGLVLGSIDTDGQLDLFDGQPLPHAVELVVHFDHSRALANPVKHASKPRARPWKFDGVRW